MATLYHTAIFIYIHTHRGIAAPGVERKPHAQTCTCTIAVSLGDGLQYAPKHNPNHVEHPKENPVTQMEPNSRPIEKRNGSPTRSCHSISFRWPTARTSAKRFVWTTPAVKAGSRRTQMGQLRGEDDPFKPPAPLFRAP